MFSEGLFILLKILLLISPLIVIGLIGLYQANKKIHIGDCYKAKVDLKGATSKIYPKEGTILYVKVHSIVPQKESKRHTIKLAVANHNFLIDQKNLIVLERISEADFKEKLLSIE